MITLQGFSTRVDLILPDLLDFNLILGMDLLDLHHSILDCYAKTAILAILGILPIVW